MVHGLSLRRFFKKLTIYIVTTQAFDFGILAFEHLSFRREVLRYQSIKSSANEKNKPRHRVRARLCRATPCHCFSWNCKVENKIRSFGSPKVSSDAAVMVVKYNAIWSDTVILWRCRVVKFGACLREGDAAVMVVKYITIWIVFCLIVYVLFLGLWLPQIINCWGCESRHREG
jgi:hypothetical protein